MSRRQAAAAALIALLAFGAALVAFAGAGDYK